MQHLTEQNEEVDLEAWFASWEWETSLPLPTKTEAAAQARRHAAGLAFDRERVASGDDAEKILRAVACGVLAERFDDVQTFFESSTPAPLSANSDWREMLRLSLFSGWTEVLAKTARTSDGQVAASIAKLRATQSDYEKPYLDASPEPRAAAWELVALYHVLGALAQVVDGKPTGDVQASLDRSIRSCLRADHYELHGLICRVSAALRVIRGDGFNDAERRQTR